MMRVGLLALLFGLTVSTGWAQDPATPRTDELARLPSIVSNDVRTLAPAGDSLWIGPLLTLYLAPEDRPRPEARLLVADEPVLTEQDNIAFSIAARNADRQSKVWAGLAFDTGGGEPGAGGFLVSTDGGASFDRRDPQLDAPGDTTLSYGGSTLSAAAVTQQPGSVPRGIAFGPDDTTWVAGLRSGLRWSTDGGESWTRAVLPPDTSRSVDPATPTDVFVGPPLDDGRGSLNHVGYSVLVDETGTVWAGTGAGLNRSRPGSVTAAGRRAWRRFSAADPTASPPGNLVVALAEQPRPDARNPIWMASWASEQRGDRLQRFGVAVTPNGGGTFRRTLIGERIFDLAARSGRVYAAGETGLFVSGDQGNTWRSVERFPLRDENETLPSTATPRSVAVTEAALWVGTTEGLLRLDRTEESRLLRGNPEWDLLRSETPVNPEEPSEQVPDVSTYAYPNPYVPSRDDLVRIVYELESARTVEVNIYDFGMNHVRTITEQKPAGQQETVWRGRDEEGLRVPTGTYIYTVELGDRTIDGKIVVAN